MDEPNEGQQAIDDAALPLLSISEVSEKTGISAFTIRYYDKCGFFPNLYRGKNKVRCFSYNDLMWLRLVDALRKSGLSIEGIKYFVRLSLQGNRSLSEQYAILENQETVLEYQLAEIQESLNVLHEAKAQKEPGQSAAEAGYAIRH
ncbi:MAG: MerR family transcriptional regulator [Eggerthellaceae bacterium]|nr:MerR family transcriptional regulator [Eggerthellaceae bacterium]